MRSEVVLGWCPPMWLTVPGLKRHAPSAWVGLRSRWISQEVPGQDYLHERRSYSESERSGLNYRLSLSISFQMPAACKMCNMKGQPVRSFPYPQWTDKPVSLPGRLGLPPLLGCIPYPRQKLAPWHRSSRTDPKPVSSRRYRLTQRALGTKQGVLMSELHTHIPSSSLLPAHEC